MTQGAAPSCILPHQPHRPCYKAPRRPEARMPKHTYCLTYLLDKFPALKHNAQSLGKSVFFGAANASVGRIAVGMGDDPSRGLAIRVNVFSVA